MTVAVIGGSGFIGTRLISLLRERGVEVLNIDLAPSALHDDITTIADVRSAEQLTAAVAGAEAIVNLAAAHRDDVRPVSLYDQINVGGARAVVAAAEANGIRRIVFTSTVAVYGLGEEGGGAEDETPLPFNAYGRTKLEAEGVLREWADADPARALVIVRPSVVFGEGNRGNVFTLASQLAAGRFVMVGSGRNHKSMSYVGNVVTFLANSLAASPGVQLVNYADKPDLTTAELIETLSALLGRSRSAVHLPFPIGLAGGHVFDAVARISHRRFSISAIRIRKFVAETTVDTGRLDATGFVRPFTLPEALSRTIAADFPTPHRS